MLDFRIGLLFAAVVTEQQDLFIGPVKPRRAWQNLKNILKLCILLRYKETEELDFFLLYSVKIQQARKMLAARKDCCRFMRNRE